MCIGFKYKVCRFNGIRDMDNCFEKNLNKVIMTSSPIWFLWDLNTNRQRVYLSNISNFILIKHKRTEIQGREFNRKLWREMGITSLWPWPLTQGHQNQFGLSQCQKQPFSENRVQIGASVRVEFCSQEVRDTQTHRQTDTQTNCSENITLPRFHGGVISRWMERWINE